MDIGMRIKNVRLARGLTVSQLAAKAHISDSYIRDMESGRTNPSLDTLTTICAMLNISLSEFFGEVPLLPKDVIRLVENVQQLTVEEVQLLGDFIESIVKKQKQ